MHAIFCELRILMAKPLQNFGTAQRGVHFVARCMPGAYWLHGWLGGLSIIEQRFEGPSGLCHDLSHIRVCGVVCQ